MLCTGVCSIMCEDVVDSLAGPTLNKEVCFVNTERHVLVRHSACCKCVLRRGHFPGSEDKVVGVRAVVAFLFLGKERGCETPLLYVPEGVHRLGRAGLRRFRPRGGHQNRPFRG